MARPVAVLDLVVVPGREFLVVRKAARLCVSSNKRAPGCQRLACDLSTVYLERAAGAQRDDQMCNGWGRGCTAERALKGGDRA